MGNISSRQDDLSGSMLYLKDQSKFSIKSLTISNGRKKVLLRLSPNGVPATRVLARREPGDDAPISYVQDLDTPNANFLLRLDLEDELEFNFSFISRQQSPTQPTASTQSTASAAVDTHIIGLTFAYASNARDLDTLVTREFHSDPNLHKNSNVQLIGDLSTEGFPSIESSWSWTWRPPKSGEDKGGGWRNNCSFLEYDSRAHRLNTLASFAFWVHKPHIPLVIPAPSLPPQPQSELAIPPVRHRMASSHSYQSAVSDSEGPTEVVPPASPLGSAPESASTAPTSAPAVPAVDVGRPTEDMSNVEDGPVFRANMKQLEQKTGNMRTQVKKVLKKAEAAQQMQLESNEAIRSFLAALEEAATSHASGFRPAMEHYFSGVAYRILKYEEQNATLLRRQIIEPLSRLYTNDIKQVESKKKDFEDESREYYAYVSRYLGQRQDSLKEKKRAESDSKYQNKKKNFELKRFDYSNFMQDLHGGRKEQELLSHLTKYADGQAKAFVQTARKIEELQPQLDALVREVTEADKEYKIQRTEREEKRRNLEMNNLTATASETEGSSYTGSGQPPTNNANGSTGYVSDTDLSRADSTSSQFGSAIRSTLSPSNSQHLATNPVTLATSPAVPSTVTPSLNKFRGIRDLEERDPSTAILDKQAGCAPRKEGLLWALSKPGSHIDPKGINKQAWHKFWVVLDQGKLSEYSNWKDRMEIHRDPIDLRMASVRMARDAERRFCFEVITPQYKRVYQATAEDDMLNWINSINNALQSAFEGRASQSTPTSQKDRAGSEFGAVLTGKSLSQSGPHGVSSRGEGVGVNRRVTVGSRPAQSPTPAPQEDNPTKLLDLIRANDQGNSFCAECGSNSRVEWVSLNLGIVLCIECGGIHRSLGTHVSKIRSLTLDVNSFTDDIVEILLQIGNRISNMVWEANMDRALKLEPWANREQRLRFITTKYVERSFIVPHMSTTHAASADDNLLISIKRNDIQGVLQGIAQKANVNVHDRSRNTHAVFLALAAADPARPASTSPAASPGRPQQPGQTPPKTFPIAELLVQNGAEIPPELPAIPLSPAAQAYIEHRASRAAPLADTLGPLPSMSGAKSADQTKLQKRGSAGARFAGKVTGLSER